MRVTPKTDFYELLGDIFDFLDQYEDADYEDGRFRPNKAMQLSQRVYLAMTELESLQEEKAWPESKW